MRLSYFLPFGRKRVSLPLTEGGFSRLPCILTVPTHRRMCLFLVQVCVLRDTKCSRRIWGATWPGWGLSWRVKPERAHAVVCRVGDLNLWKAITFLCNLYSFGLEVLSCCGEVLSLFDEI